MSLPKAVQAQLEAAEALLASAQPEQEQSQQVESANAPVEQQELQVVEQPQIAETPKPVETKQVETKSDEATWEQRYKSLQGLFNARVQELQSSNRQLSQQVQQLTTKLDEITESLRKPEVVAQALVDPKDVEEFGQDLVAMVQRQAAAAVTGMLAKLDGLAQAFEKRLAAVEQQLSGASRTAAMTAEQVFFSKLSQEVPDWEQINADERFLSWLGEADPIYGVPRQVALNAAHEALDVKRVANIFNAFKSQFVQPATKRPAVEKQVSPSKVAATASPSVQDKPVFTQAQIQAFYKDVAIGKYRGREAEAAKLEQMINEAIAEGRVR